MEPARFQTESLRSSSQGDRVERVLAAALAAVEPGQAVRRYLQLEGDELIVAGNRYPLHGFRRIRVIGAGKAGAAARPDLEAAEAAGG